MREAPEKSGVSFVSGVALSERFWFTVFMPTTTTECPVVTVETAFGPVRVSAVGEEAVVVECGRVVSGEYDIAPLLVNRVEYGMRVRLERNVGARNPLGATAWSMGDTSYRVKPLDWRKMNQYPTDSARTKLRAALVEVAEWLEANGELLSEAGDRELARAVERLDRQIEDKLREIEALRVERAALVAS